MRKAFRAGVVLTAAAFATGWMYRQVFPKISCPSCGSGSWKRLGGGLKQCLACRHKFFIQLAEVAGPDETRR
jgi:ribosomal protein L37AE/L43A